MATKQKASTGKATMPNPVASAARNAAPRTGRKAVKVKQAEQTTLLRAKEKAPPVKDPRTPKPAIDDPKRDPRTPDEIEAGSS